MAGKSIPGEGLTAELAGMTKNQLYDIMSQMKVLIEQNKQQAREILIQNPSLTRALFQAQIMLGMVQPPQVIPNIAQAASQQPQPVAQHSHQSNVQAACSFAGQVGSQDQVGASHAQPQMRKQQQSQPAMSTPAASASQASLQPPSMPSHPLQMPLQPKGQLNPQVPSSSGPLSSQTPNTPQPSFHPASQPSSLHQPQMPSVSSQLQQPAQTTGFPHMSLQPPLPPQPRPSPIPGYHHPYGPQMGPNVAYQHTGGSQHPSQAIYHPGGKPQSSMGTSFPQGQPPLLSQPQPQSLYQAGGTHIGSDYNIQGGSSMQVDRGSSWMSGTADTSSIQQLPGPVSSVPGQMGTGNQSATSGLTPDMEKALLQQVMSLTQEQINLLPPDQRNQVLQLQQMLRQ